VSIIVTGTDTDVGKTIVSALLLLRYPKAAYWKPVATGLTTGRDSADITRWTDAQVLEESYLYDPPVSPHLAARLARQPIQRQKLLRDFATHRRESRRMVIEGIGGTMVPFNERGYFFADFARDLGLAAVVVARTAIGTINHTMLTLAALRDRKVPVAGVVLNGPSNPENRRAIERIGKVRVIGEVRPISTVGRASLARAARKLDAARVLRRYLG
jgi:dethiobiotin synthetase